MRTTLTIDDDVAALLKTEQEKQKKPLKQLVNDALRRGLSSQAKPSQPKKRFRTKTYNLGPSLIGSLDNIGEVLEKIEGPWHK